MRDWADSTAEFTAAAGWLVQLAGEVGPDQWDRPGIGEWDVRALLGHASRALATVEEYLADPPDEATDITAARYVGSIRRADPTAIAARGVAAGEALGHDPHATVAALADRVTALVRTKDATSAVNTAFGGMALGEYLPTRTFELIVHGLDLATAIGSATAPPAAPTEACARLVVEASIAGGGAAALCELLTGRPESHGRASPF